MSKFCEKSYFLGGFRLTVLEQDMGTTQIFCHSQTKSSVVISRIFRGAMDSSLFREWCTNQRQFLKKSEFRNYEVKSRELWPYNINQMKDGIPIDDFKSSEPRSGSSLFLYGRKKSPKPRFSIITIKS